MERCLKEFQCTFLSLKTNTVLLLVVYFRTKEVQLDLAWQSFCRRCLYDGLRSVLATTCTVIRNGNQKIEVEHLVPVISFSSTMAPQFLQIWSCSCAGLKTENSSLTGESDLCLAPIECRGVGTRICSNVQNIFS
jgi:magnesium-transporting ATPase (P-type)